MRQIIAFIILEYFKNTGMGVPQLSVILQRPAVDMIEIYGFQTFLTREIVDQAFSKQELTIGNGNRKRSVFAKR
jgi:hypothetical protein